MSETTTPPITTPQALAAVGAQQQESINAFSNADAFATAQRMAKAISQSSMIPKEYQNNLPNCIVAMEMAARIGASVLAVMQSLDVIHGRPAWRATFLIATVNACGRFTSIRYRWEGQPGKPTHGCRAVAIDRETGEECVGTLITVKMANDEGWTKKNGSKWLTMPEQMLMYRAAAFWTRVYAPELSLGMHTSDEQEDMGPQPSSAGAITQLGAESPLVSRAAKAMQPEVSVETIATTSAGEPYDTRTGEVFDRAPTDVEAEPRERQPGEDDDELPDEFA